MSNVSSSREAQRSLRTANKKPNSSEEGQLIWMDLANLGSEAKIRNSIPLSPGFVFFSVVTI